MKRSGMTKFPHSVRLFKFCQKVLLDCNGKKVNDQEIGIILNFSPSDCSHWKRGEKNIKSVSLLSKLAKSLHVDESIIYDLASSSLELDEAFYEYQAINHLKRVSKCLTTENSALLYNRRKNIISFVEDLHAKSAFLMPPLYLPEVIRFFTFVTINSSDMYDQLSRVLRIKAGKYVIKFRKGELTPQTRMSMVFDLARIIFEGERQQFPILDSKDAALVEWEKVTFAVNLLVPKKMLTKELTAIDPKKNIIQELSKTFWVPKSLISFQIQDMMRSYDAHPSKEHVDHKTTPLEIQTSTSE